MTDDSFERQIVKETVTLNSKLKKDMMTPNAELTTGLWMPNEKKKLITLNTKDAALNAQIELAALNAGTEKR